MPVFFTSRCLTEQMALREKHHSPRSDVGIKLTTQLPPLLGHRNSKKHCYELTPKASFGTRWNLVLTLPCTGDMSEKGRHYTARIQKKGNEKRQKGVIGDKECLRNGRNWERHCFQLKITFGDKTSRSCLCISYLTTVRAPAAGSIDSGKRFDSGSKSVGQAWSSLILKPDVVRKPNL